MKAKEVMRMGRNLSRTFHRGGDDLHPFGPPLARIFHDQNRVLLPSAIRRMRPICV
jgi:hypothetical protein